MTPTEGKTFPGKAIRGSRQHMRKIYQTVANWTAPVNPHLRLVILSCGHRRVVDAKRFGMIICLKCKAMAKGAPHADQA